MNSIIRITSICLAVMATINDTAAEDNLRRSFSSRTGESGWHEQDDLNGDGIIDGYDLAIRTNPENRIKGGLRYPDYRADRLLVKFHPGYASDSARMTIEQLGVDSKKIKVVKNLDYVIIPVPEALTIEVFLQQIRALSSVADAQFDYICRISKTPNDEYYSLQWNFRQVGSEFAWDLTSGGDNSVVVAVLDTGIAYENFGAFERAPDLAGTAFRSGFDFINDDSHPNDDEGHGTHVAGTIAQTTDNNIGTSGLAYRCSLMPIKVLDANGNGTSSSLAQGIRWAADKGAHVINMSLGFPVGSTGGSVVRDAVAYAYGKGVILVAASGNEANDPGYNGGVAYPAAYDECIAVGAVRYDKRFTDYSNYGAKLTCVAPGGAIAMDQNGDGNPDGILQQTFIDANPTKFRFVFYQGTSMATPHVAAAAALFVSRKGGGPGRFLQVLKETCDDLGQPGFDERYGYGLINLPKIILTGQGWGAN